MGTTIYITRFLPESFKEGTDKLNKSISQSEALSRAVFAFIKKMDDDEIIRGDANKGEPDFIFRQRFGLEVRFANNQSDSSGGSIARIYKEQYAIIGIESDIINSITDAIEDKAKKNYKGVDSISLFIVLIDPFFGWYKQNLQSPKWTQSRDQFFEHLYKLYIESSKFQNIYILQLTEYKTYALFDILAFNNPPSVYLTVIGSDKITSLLPYCEITDFQPDDDWGSLFTYKMTNVIIKNKT